MTATLHYIHRQRGEAVPRECGPPAGPPLQAVRELLLSWQTNVAGWRSLVGPDKALRALAALDDDDIGNLSETGRRLRLQARQQLWAAETNGRPRRTGFPSMLEGSRR